MTLPVSKNFTVLVLCIVVAIVTGACARVVENTGDTTAEADRNMLEELQSSGVDESALDRETLMKLIERVSDDEQFVVRIADIDAGRALKRGKTEPLTPQQAKDDAGNNSGG